MRREIVRVGKLLLVERLSPDGRPDAKYDIAVDVVQAGVGDTVLVLDEGNSARQIVGREPDGAIRALIVGIVDQVALENEGQIGV